MEIATHNRNSLRNEKCVNLNIGFMLFQILSFHY